MFKIIAMPVCISQSDCKLTELTIERNQLMVSFKESLNHLNAQMALYDIVSYSMSDKPLKEILSFSLNKLLGVSWLTVERKGSIFVADGNDLVMMASEGLNDALAFKCARIKFGQCLCGVVAMTKKHLFKPNVDHEHTIGYHGMPEHGHIIYPLVVNTILYGVLNLYVHKDYEEVGYEQLFLEQVSSTLTDVIKKRLHDSKIILESTIDPLTKVFNRRALDCNLNNIHQDNRRGHTIIAMVDIDHFKSVNDTYGHHTGDVVLAHVSKIMRETLREVDYIARYGGEEFVIILHNTTPTDAQITLDKVRESVYKNSLNGLQISVSIGYSEYAHDDTPISVVEHADSAMYQAKNGGRNQVRMFKYE